MEAVISDSILRYVPVDPVWQPTLEAANKAAALLKSISIQYDDVQANFEDKVVFYDPGESWSGVECPACGVDAEEWWSEAMDTAFANDFSNLMVEAPCCGATMSMNDLHYVWPAAFGRFVLEAHNPNMGEPTPEQDQQLAEILGSPLRKIWVRI